MDKIKLSANEWGLYDATMDCSKAANALNKRFNACYKGNLTRDIFKARMFDVMRTYSAFGAYDTEPRNKLKRLLDTIYN